MHSSTKVIFKDYTQKQLSLLPPSLEELIEENHPVRVINHVIEKIDLHSLIQKYEGGGTSSYHPRMMLKVLVYAYVSNIYSSRKIESAIKENIHFMWLSAYNKHDHNTINRFRSDRLKGVFKEIFTQVVMMLVESGHIDLQKVYLDGTKIEAYVKYNYFHMEQHKKGKATPDFHQDKLYYNKDGDYYVCPIGQKMNKIGVKKIINDRGFTQELHLYQAQNCKGCHLRCICHKSKKNRVIQINNKLKKYKTKAKKLLLSEKGLKHRSQRPVDVEAVFGNIKQNKKFTRLNLKGNEKIEIEIGLVYLSHNLLKYARTA
jgi:transposase